MRQSITLTVLFATVLGLSLPALAQPADPYPSRPIQVVVPLTAGSVLDLLARALTDAMARTSPQPFVVLNREGAAGVIGTTLVARAKADGYTLGFGGDSAVTVQPHVAKDLAYSLDSFEFVCQVAYAPMVVVVGPESPFRSFGELVAAAKKAPQPLRYATVGNASMMHLVGESIASEGDIRLVHIPFRSVADMNTQTINGNVDFTITLPNILTLGRGLRALALTADEPMDALPAIPLLGTLGWKRSVLSSAHILFAPRGLAPDAMAWLRKACAEAVASDSFRAATTRTHSMPRHNDGERLGAWMRQMWQDYGERVRRIALQAG